MIIGSVIALLSTVNTWVERQALHTDSWVEATDQLLEDDDVRGALATYLVEELYSSLSIEEAVAEALPSDLERLAGLVAGALRGPAIDTVDSLLDSDVVRTAWREANRRAHSLLVAAIDDDPGDVLSVGGGEISIDLGELVRALGERLGLGDDFLDRLSEDAGVIVLFEADELELVQDAANAVKLLSAFLFLVVVGLYAVAVYLSHDKRRTIRDVGLGLVTVGALVLLLRILGINALIEAVSSTGDDEPAQSVLDIGSTLLRQIAFTEIIIGLFLVAFAALAGPSDPARRVRGMLAPALGYGVASMVLGGLGVYLVLLWLKPGGPIDGWILALGTAALCVAGVGWVQRVMVSEPAAHREG